MRRPWSPTASSPLLPHARTRRAAVPHARHGAPHVGHDVDDGAATGSAHRRDDGLDAVEDPDQVDVEHGAEVIQRLVLEELAGGDAGVVHQTGDLAELRDSQGDSRVPLSAIGDVQVRVPRRVPELGGQLRALVVEDVSDDDLAATGHDVPCH